MNGTMTITALIDRSVVRRMSRLFRKRWVKNRYRATTINRRLKVESLEERELLAFSPTPLEQEMLEHVNRMRLDPQGELDVLFNNISSLQTPDSNVNAALDYFNVDPNRLMLQWESLTPTTPLAWNEGLYDAARAHSDLMIQHDQQAHNLPGEASLLTRIVDAGYEWTGSIGVGENIFSYAENVFHGHAGFVIDWGFGPGGIQNPAGHRLNIMNPAFQEVGIGIIAENDGATDVGPFVVTQDFGRRGNFGDGKVMGVVYEDANHNGRFDAGEGQGDITVKVSGSGGTFAVQTWSSGGYQVAVAPGEYTVTASGGMLNGPVTVDEIIVQTTNVKVDLDTTNLPVSPAPVFEVNGHIVDVYGTAGDDVIEVVAGTTHSITIDGQTREFDGATITRVNVHAGEGHDSVTLRGSGQADNVHLRSASVDMIGGGYEIHLQNADSVWVFAGEGLDQTARIFDTPDDEVLTARPESVRLTGPDRMVYVSGFDEVRAYATAGGDDRAYFHDGPANDRFVGRENYSLMRSDDSGFYNYARGFDAVRAYATAGGIDHAKLYDGPADDLFVGRHNYGFLRGDNSTFYNYAKGFDRVYAYATAGGGDRAKLYDGSTDDRFVGRHRHSYLRGNNFEFYNYARSFERVFAYATAGGDDRAYLYDNITNDVFVGRPEYSLLRGENFEFYNYANGFDQVRAFSTAGGNDTARLYDAETNDQFIADENYGLLHGDGFYNYIRGFNQVHAESTGGGTDLVILYDSPDRDLFYGRANYGFLQGSEFHNRATGFDSIRAISIDGGPDTVDVSAVDYAFEQQGDWI